MHPKKIPPYSHYIVIIICLKNGGFFVSYIIYPILIPFFDIFVLFLYPHDIPMISRETKHEFPMNIPCSSHEFPMNSPFFDIPCFHEFPWYSEKKKIPMISQWWFKIPTRISHNHIILIKHVKKPWLLLDYFITSQLFIPIPIKKIPLC